MNNTYLAPKYVENMLSERVKATGADIKQRPSSLRELLGIGKLYSSISNQALSNTLEKSGVTCEKVYKFSLDYEDTLFTVQVDGINGPIRNYSDYPEIPEPYNLIINRIDVKKPSK